jgi:hypothetical protein
MSIRMAILATETTMAALAAANTPSGRGLGTSPRRMDRALHFAKLQAISSNRMVNSLGRTRTNR